MKRLVLLTILLLCAVQSHAQLYAMRDSVANGYNFWLYLPDGYAERAKILRDSVARDSMLQDSMLRDSVLRDSVVCDSVVCRDVRPEEHRALPIIVFLHGKSLCGTNLYTVRKYGTLDALTMGRKIDAVVVAPQNRGDNWWKPERVMNIVEWVSERYEVDTTRLYVLGMSLGGYGALDFAAAYPERTAATIGLCGGSTCNDPSQISCTPTWIIHGTADKAVPVSASRRVRDAVVKADSCNLLRYDELAGVGHSLLARVFYLGETYEWLFKHSTADSVRTVHRDINITTERLNRAYKDLKLNSVKLNVIDPAGSTAATSSTEDVIWYTIRQGDTLGHIAAKHHTTVKRLCALNNLTEKSIIRAGQKIKVSAMASSSASSATTSSTASATSSDEAVWYKVCQGDTLGHIAAKHHTTVKRLCALNNISEKKLLQIGQKLRVK